MPEEQGSIRGYIGLVFAPQQNCCTSLTHPGRCIGYNPVSIIPSYLSLEVIVCQTANVNHIVNKLTEPLLLRASIGLFMGVGASRS